MQTPNENLVELIEDGLRPIVGPDATLDQLAYSAAEAVKDFLFTDEHGIDLPFVLMVLKDYLNCGDTYRADLVEDQIDRIEANLLPEEHP